MDDPASLQAASSYYLQPNIIGGTTSLAATMTSKDLQNSLVDPYLRPGTSNKLKKTTASSQCSSLRTSNQKDKLEDLNIGRNGKIKIGGSNNTSEREFTTGLEQLHRGGRKGKRLVPVEIKRDNQ